RRADGRSEPSRGSTGVEALLEDLDLDVARVRAVEEDLHVAAHRHLLRRRGGERYDPFAEQARDVGVTGSEALLGRVRARQRIARRLLHADAADVHAEAGWGGDVTPELRVRARSGEAALGGVARRVAR